MSVRRRFAACEACRSAKVACDHGRPACGRCVAADEGDRCTYRDRPFKKRKRLSSDSRNSTPIATSNREVNPSSTSYTNTGYHGPLTQEAIFHHLSRFRAVERDSGYSDDSKLSSKHPDSSLRVADIARGAEVLKNAQATPQLSRFGQLAQAWISKGYNLALAASFISQCIIGASGLLQSLPDRHASLRDASAQLLRNSLQSLHLDSSATPGDFQDYFCNDANRWESLAMFFATVSRAAVDIERFEPLYATVENQRDIQKLAMRLSDQCLDMALSLECLNDLQLIVQYENFIAHSHVDGDQSYHSWKRLGDVISSIFALGYHQAAVDDLDVPPFLRTLRNVAIARVYSAEINVSIFHGRPPRLRRSDLRSLLQRDVNDDFQSPVSDQMQLQAASPDQRIEYAADTRWSSRCATIKEDVVRLFNEKPSQEKSQSASLIKDRILRQWMQVPSPQRLEETSTSERDLLVSMRLQHLHMLFLVEMALSDDVTAPSAALSQASADLLRLTAQAVMLKNYLMNTGTGIVWRVVHYGLPAAGIVCLCLSQFISSVTPVRADVVQMVQDLSTLVTQVETGALTSSQHPNYALLQRGVTAIKSVLNRTVGFSFDRQAQAQSAVNISAMPGAECSNTEPDAWAFLDNWNFEQEFWPGLAEYPNQFSVD